MTVGYARVVCCDSTIPGEAGGELSDPDWLDATLAEAPGTPTSVAMHHPRSASAWAGSTRWDTPGPALHFVDGRTAVTHFRPVGEAALNAR
ncbi:MAG: metallophosphoesterase [Actinoallomurus sp.]|nr:metallophosphoesterase [Actinoallomurus sp.]